MEKHNEETSSQLPLPAPGPWWVGYSHNRDNRHIGPDTLTVWPANISQGRFGEPVCQVTPVDKMNQTDLANAQLIAHAPEMKLALSELIEAKAAAEQDECHSLNEGIHLERIGNAFKQAIRVLQQASKAP